ncbi:hypothetical protein BGZ76_009401 [Entomortierella beljakovae]|nr:hypothetical protein BGZ76_009401 [Entomortierella beljakovae]
MEKVIIVGGGLAGMLLAVILEKTSIDYIILERSTVAKMPIEGGGVIVITTQIQPLLDQLGLLESLKKLSRPVCYITLLETYRDDDSLKTIGSFDTTFSYSRHGEYTLAISRPELINHLIDQIPSEKILLGKQVDKVEQDEEEIEGGGGGVKEMRATKARCICMDGSVFEGIIIGADGAYSNVRLNLYRHLKNEGTLPKSDRVPMKVEYRSLLGMTESLDPKRFSLVTGEFSEPRILISSGSSPYTIWCIPMTENRIYWMLDELLPEPQDCPEVEDWSLIESTGKEMCEKYGMMSSPIEGVTLKELFELTPTSIAGLIREEGLFSTWANGRIALMGDGMFHLKAY